MNALANGTWTLKELKNIANTARNQISIFSHNISVAIDGMKNHIARAMGGNLSGISFNDFWRQVSKALVEGLAKDFCNVVTDLDVQNLLKFKPICALAGYSANQMYEGIFNGRRVQTGDSRDQLHAILASAADVLVTHEKTLQNWLMRVPGLHVTGVN